MMSTIFGFDSALKSDAEINRKRKRDLEGIVGRGLRVVSRNLSGGCKVDSG